jgi:arylsulfatase A-like enzyme
MEPHAAYDPPQENIIGEENVEPWPEDLTNRDTHYHARDEWPDMPPGDQELLEANLRLLYDGEIRTIDERLASVWAEMEAEGYLDDTLVVIWNDHGEQFWEHDHQTHAFAMHGEENDGFAIFWSRNIVPQHYVGPTSAIDLVATVLDLFGIDRPPEITGYPVGTAPADRPRFAESLARLGGVNMVFLDGLKMQFFWSGRVTLYDRNTDPLEQNDLYVPGDVRVMALWALLKPQAIAMEELVVGGSPVPNFPPELP